MSEIKILRVTGIVPGCLIKTMLNNKVVTGKVQARITNQGKKMLLCGIGKDYITLPEEECQLYAVSSGTQLFDTRGRLLE